MTFHLFMGRSNLRPHRFVWENVDKSFSHNVLKTNNCFLQCMVIHVVVKLFSNNQIFAIRGLSFLAPGLCTSINSVNPKTYSSPKLFDQFSKDLT